jgi:hypothetical protein
MADHEPHQTAAAIGNSVALLEGFCSFHRGQRLGTRLRVGDTGRERLPPYTARVPTRWGKFRTVRNSELGAAMPARLITEIADGEEIRLAIGMPCIGSDILGAICSSGCLQPLSVLPLPGILLYAHPVPSRGAGYAHRGV